MVDGRMYVEGYNASALRTLPSIEGMSADQIIKAALRAMMQQ